MARFANPFHAASSPRVGTDQCSTVYMTPQPTIRAPSPLTAQNPPFVSVPNDDRNSGFGIPHGIVQHERKPSPGGATNPTLIRTSALQQSNDHGQNQSFNPYMEYYTKAILKLNGDLDAMAESWTKAERESQRRLVQFTRFQTGSTIHAQFKPITPGSRTPTSICISCISWEGKNECFVTSVDTIYLLESLVAMRFTVEEKNRIRRNLESFRPLTVSKAKAESKDFFNVIMGFPAPKPRSIERDVKVFPWKVLSHALKKIIGKYSAGCSSTADALPMLITTYVSHGMASDSGTEPHRATSPPLICDSGLANNYVTSTTAALYLAQMDQSCLPLTVAPDLQSAIPAVSPPYVSVGAYPYKDNSKVENSAYLTAIKFMAPGVSTTRPYLVFNGEYCLEPWYHSGPVLSDHRITTLLKG